jgi:predicted Fe-Mo cluster-binding NifX family protein
MKYAIPIIDKNDRSSLVGEHFGRVPFYGIWDDENDSLEIIPNESNHFGGVGLPAEFLATKSEAIICKGIGRRAIDLCTQLGVILFVGATGTVQETIDLLKSGKLKRADQKDGCDH